MKNAYRTGHPSLIAVSATALLLAACGGGNNNNDDTTTPRACGTAFQDSIAVAFTNDGESLVFQPDEVGNLPDATPVNGLSASETIVGADFNPKNNQIIAVTNTGRFLRGVAQGDCDEADSLEFNFMPLNNAGGGGAFTTAPANRISIAFNPTVNAFRIFKGDGSNQRVLLSDNGAEVSSVINDTGLTYATGDVNAGRSPTAVDLAYTNQILTNGAVPAASSVYALDFVPDQDLVISRLGAAAPGPNAGILTTLSDTPEENLPNVGTAGPFFDIDPEQNNRFYIVGGDNNDPELFSATLAQFEAASFMPTEVGDIFAAPQATLRITAFTILPSAAFNNQELSTLTP